MPDQFNVLQHILFDDFLLAVVAARNGGVRNCLDFPMIQRAGASAADAQRV
jgi:hypothetical protein